MCKEKDRSRRHRDAESNLAKYGMRVMTHNIKACYNITVKEYVECMNSSGGVCEVCGTTENLCYDHCHNSMKFRGVLCKKCNIGIGALGDTLDGVTKAMNYLEKHYGVE